MRIEFSVVCHFFFCPFFPLLSLARWPIGPAKADPGCLRGDLRFLVSEDRNYTPPKSPPCPRVLLVDPPVPLPGPPHFSKTKRIRESCTVAVSLFPFLLPSAFFF